MRGIAAFLDNDSTFGRICGLLGTLIVTNLLFVVCLIPVVTAGAGFCALNYSMLRLVREREINPFAVFVKGFRDNFKQATLAELLLAALALFLWTDARICSYMSGPLKLCVTVVYGAVLALIVITLHLFAVIAAFRGNLRTLVKYSVYFAGSAPAGAVMITLISTVPLFMTYLNPQMLPLAAFLWCMCGFSVITLCNAMILMRRFGRYLDPAKEENAPRKTPGRRKILAEMKKLEG